MVQQQRQALGGVLRPFLFFEKEPKIPAGVSKRGRCFVETHRNTSKGLSLLQDLVSAAVSRQRWSSSFNFAIISNLLSESFMATAAYVELNKRCSKRRIQMNSGNISSSVGER